MLANAGIASTVALANGRGGEIANQRATFGTIRAVIASQKDDCNVCGST